jgi:hypothetical protein
LVGQAEVAEHVDDTVGGDSLAGELFERGVEGFVPALPSLAAGSVLATWP